MIRAYREYKHALDNQGKNQDDLAVFLNLSTIAIRQKLNLKRPWKDHEMYKALEFIHEPDEKLAKYFPRNGGIAS